MNKFTLTFVLLATMAGVSRSQESLLPLPNVVNFTPNFQFSWGYDNTTITIQLEVVTAGWVSIAVLKDDGKGFDMWWGGFDEDYGIVYGQVPSRKQHRRQRAAAVTRRACLCRLTQDGYASFNNLVVGPRYPDTFNNLNVVQVAQSPFGGTTRLRFSRPIISPDYKQDVNIPYVSLAEFYRVLPSFTELFWCV